MKCKRIEDGSDNNCRSFYSEVTSPSSSYYESNEHHSSNPSNNTNNNNHHHNRPNSVVSQKTDEGWISSDQSSRSVNNLNGSQELKSEAHEQHSAVVVNELRPSSKAYANSNQHFPIHNPQWNFSSTLGNSYRLYNDYHYIISPSAPQQCALVPSSSVPSGESDSQANHHHHIHPMQATTHHLKKLFYQGSQVFSNEKN